MDTTVNLNVGFTGLIGALLVLAGVGGTIVLTPDQFDNTYICGLTEEVGVFDRLSGTEARAYPTSGTTKGYKDCKTSTERGKWVKLEVYAKSKGLDPMSFIVGQEDPKKFPEDVNYEQVGKQWLCSVNGCVRTK